MAHVWRELSKARQASASDLQLACLLLNKVKSPEPFKPLTANESDPRPQCGSDGEPDAEPLSLSLLNRASVDLT